MRHFMKTAYLKTISAILLVFFSCSKFEEKKNDLLQKSKNKLTNTSEKVWKKGVEKAFEYSTEISTTNFEDIYGKNSNISIKNQSGKRIEYIGNFYQCFLKYDADKNEILNFLNSLKTNHPEISDKKHSIIDNQLINEKLNFVKSKFPEIYEQINFFTYFEKEKYLEYYQINKYPHSNILIFSKENGKIYHFVENYQD